MQQQQAGEGEQETGDGKDVDEPFPRGPGVAPLVQIIEVADPATAGRFARYFPVMPIDRSPPVAAGTGQRQIDFVGRPFRLEPCVAAFRIGLRLRL